MGKVKSGCQTSTQAWKTTISPVLLNTIEGKNHLRKAKKQTFNQDYQSLKSGYQI
jgi:hypothetical protein